jgi:hypothetical protein
MAASLGLTTEQKLERRRAQNQASRRRELPEAKAIRLARRRARETIQRQAIPRKVKVVTPKVRSQEQLERRRALTAARKRAYDKRRRAEQREARAALPKLPKLQASKKKRSVYQRLEDSARALQEWKQNGYQPSEYVVPPLAEQISFDRTWWASLSHGEQVKILTMGTVETARAYAAASKRRFIDNGYSLG